MKNLGLLTIIFLTFAFNLFGQDEKKLEQLLVQAQRYKSEASDALKFGNYIDGAAAYSKAIKLFTDLTDPKEIEITEETLYLLHNLRAICYLSAKQSDLADADYQKYLKFNLKKAQNYYDKSKAESASKSEEIIKQLTNAFGGLVEVYRTQENRNGIFTQIFRKTPEKNLVSDKELEEIDELLKNVLLDWGRIETETFLKTGNWRNAEEAKLQLTTIIKRFPNEVVAYRLMEKIYRKQGKNIGANEFKEKADKLEKTTKP